MNDMSLIQEFVQEAREYIDEVEPTLIEICQSSELGTVDSELINSVFRLFHSMKGSAGFLSLTTVTSVTHEAETLLDKIRNGKLNLTVPITETLCRALDLFREMLDVIVETGEDTGFDDKAAAMIAKLKKHVAGEPVESGVPETSVPAPVAAPAPTATTPVNTSTEGGSDLQAALEIAQQNERAATAVLEAAIAAGNNPTDDEIQAAISARNARIDAEDALAAAGGSPAAANPSGGTPPAPSADQSSGEHEIASMQLSPEMKAGFVTEATEQLESAEQALLKVLDESDPSESLKDIFRYIHSFKGNCGFMGFSDIEKLSHAMETLLDNLRNGVIKPEEKNISKLLSFIDVLETAVTNIGGGGAGHIADLQAHVEVLRVLTEGGAASVHPAAPQAEPVAAATAAPHPAAAAAGGTKASAGKQDIRVDLHKLDALINLVGELVIAESMVTRCQAVAHVEDEYYNRAKHQLRRICDDIKDVAMSVRMIPLSATFRKMIRLVHDLSTKSGKKIKLTLLGEETEVDKTVIEQIADPLVHIVRNSCDHGVEVPAERVQNGKDETGNVTMEGRHEGGEVWIVIRDDGRGLNRKKIIEKALEKGLVGSDVNDWSDDRIFKLIFEPGFSTADKITDISGRGVGMDVVKRNIEKLNGRIDIQSVAGQGSTFTLRIPLTLAIVDAMLVRVGTGRYMIPTLTIRESLVPTMNQITITPDGREILRLRAEMVPVIRLYDVFGREPGSDRLKDGILIVAEDSGRSFAF
ncbi:MAG: chemotaxis protein CheA, partial [Planctomycetaceae bacterium]|nr:chemotaxis protein CheA [Planctomycetaceae bacterium]